MVTPASISSRRLRVAQQAVGPGEFDTVVDAEAFAGVADAQGFHVVAVAMEDVDHVGEVVFASGVIGAKLVEVAPENVGAVTVDAHVGFADGQLFGGSGLLLHDGGHAVVELADDATVAGGVIHDGAEQHTGGAGTLLGIDETAEGVGAQQRAIAVDNGEIAIEIGQCGAGGHEGVAGAFCSVCSMNPMP